MRAQFPAMLTDPALIEALTFRGLAPKTVKTYRLAIHDVGRWCEDQGTDLDTMSATSLAAFIATKPPSWSTRHRFHCSLQHYWEIVKRADPPLAVIRRPPKPRMVCRALDEDDSRILAKAARARGDRKGLAVCCGLYAALRREEIATLRWDAFSDDGHDEWLRVTGKREKTADIPVHPVLAELLACEPRTSEWVFPGRYPHRPVCPATIWDWVRIVARDAGVPVIPPHILRHTSLAEANDATGDLRGVQEFARHSDPEMTSGYTRVSTRRLRAVVASLSY